jgi:hypothetical protein
MDKDSLMRGLGNVELEIGFESFECVLEEVSPSDPGSIAIDQVQPSDAHANASAARH